MSPGRRPTSRTPPHRVVMLGFPQAQILDVTGPLEVFSRTARWLAEHRGARDPAYTTEFVAARAGPVTMSNGLELVATRRYADVRDADTLLLAAAGLLDGKPATTHWAYLDRLSAMAPRARIDRDALYVRAGNLYTSAGVTAGMDLSLALIEQDHGKAVALAVAQELVLFLKRPGGQSQFSRHLEAQRRDDLFGELELWMLENPRADLSIEGLARRMSMSPRHFARLFRARLGASPGDYVRRLRVECARRRIGEGATRLKQVARESGFADEQSLRRTFQRQLGITPAEYRARF